MRICTKCKKPMRSGYIIHNGEEYYCSDECLYSKYTEQEYLDLYDNGNGDSFWTTWECDED